MTLAPLPPISDKDCPKFFRPENNTTTEGQGWVSFVLRNLEDVDSILALKRMRSPDTGIRESIQPGEIKEIWFHAILPEVDEFIVYVIVLFKSPTGQLYARGWFTQAPRATALGQKPQCEEFRDSAVKYYRNILNSSWCRAATSIPESKVTNVPEAIPKTLHDPESFSTPSWMRPETHVESPAGISVYHLGDPKDVEDFINDPRVSRASITPNSRLNDETRNQARCRRDPF
jgi:hypothetical protein